MSNYITDEHLIKATFNSAPFVLFLIRLVFLFTNTNEKSGWDELFLDNR